MKGIIVEVNKRDAVVLTDDGTFQKIKNKDYVAGQEINFKQVKKTKGWIAGAASFAAAAAMFTIGTWAYFTPTDYVSLDVNPSIEYSVNKFDRILEAKAVNDDGENILTSLHMDHMKIEKGVKITIDQLIKDGYLTDDANGGVIITTSNSKMDQAQKLAEELKQEVRAYIDQKENLHPAIVAEAVSADKVKEAKALGVTPGKLNLVEKLKSSSGDQVEIKTEEWLTRSVKDINKAIKENREKRKGNREADWDDEDEWDSEDDTSDDAQQTNAFVKDRDKYKEKDKNKDKDRDYYDIDEDKEDDNDRIYKFDKLRQKNEESDEKNILKNQNQRRTYFDYQKWKWEDEDEDEDENPGENKKNRNADDSDDD